MIKTDTTSFDPYIKITYTKTDTLIKNFLEAEVADELSISKIVQLALEYHAVTGGFIQLGTVNSEDEHPAKQRKTIYIPKGSDAEKYIVSIQAAGKARKRAICDVLANCVDIGSVTQLIDFRDYIIRQNELIKLKQGQKPGVVSKKAVETVAYTEKQVIDVPPQSQIQEPASKKETITKTTLQKKSKRLTFGDKFIQSDF